MQRPALCRISSTTDSFYLVPQFLQLGGDARPLVALDLDAPVLHSSTRSAALLQSGGKLAQTIFIERQIEYRGHTLAAPASNLAPHFGGQWLTRNFSSRRPFRPFLRQRTVWAHATAKDAGY